MKKCLVLKILSTVVLLIVFCSPVSAAIIVDQNQPVHEDMNNAYPVPYVRFDDPSYNSAQSFMQTGDNIAGAGIFLSNDGAYLPPPFNQEVTISVWDALPNQAGASKLASSSAWYTSVIGEIGSWFDVYWATPVSITPASTYYLVFESTTTSLLGISGNGSGFFNAANAYDAYGNGQLYAGDLANPFKPYLGWDYTFRTYYDTVWTPGPGPGPVPEPATLLLLGLGLVGLAGVKRKLNK